MSRRPRLLDLFCGAGGAAAGYHRAGFDVVGIDIRPQPRFPFTFIQADALAPPVRLADFDLIHASPPCQVGLEGFGSLNRTIGRDYAHHELVTPTRELLRAAGRPYVIEQPLPGVRLHAPVRLCGSSFGLPIHRHRAFEVSELVLTPDCEHDRLREKRFWTGYRPGGKSKVVQVYGNGGNRELWGPALGIDWMTSAELTQAIPPAYTHWLGEQLRPRLAL